MTNGHYYSQLTQSEQKLNRLDNDFILSISDIVYRKILKHIHRNTGRKEFAGSVPL